MNIALRPSTLRVLNAFRHRRQQLLWCRAGLSLLAVALAAVIVIALLDRVRFMPEWLRPWTTLLAYGGGLWAAWRVALRFLRHARDETGVARLMETAAPALRERLLSAVELARTNVTDSAEFRAQLQDQVAAELEKLDLKAALPSRTLRPWIFGIAGAMALILALSLVPTLNMPGFLARAVVPFANLERPSSIKVVIKEPHPASTLAPFASDVEIVAEIDGPMPKSVIMETQAGTGRVQNTTLRHTSGARHEGVITVGQSDVRYRLLAGDTITPWWTLSARARPRVTEFAKVIVPPAYSGLPEIRVTDDHGDLEALDGSLVKLALKTNEVVSHSEIVVNPEQPTHPAPVPAMVDADGILKAELVVKPEHSSWRMALRAKETGFTNEEASPWQITAIPDLPPVVQITEPREQLELLADESVRLAGIASDDVGLASVKMAYAVNGADWREKELAGKVGKEAAVQHVLPLAPLNVRPGDAVLIKLAATDLKGQRAECPAIRVIVLEQTVDPKQRQWAAETRRLAQQAQSLSEEARELSKAVAQVQKSVKAENKKPDEMNRADDALARAKSSLEQVSTKAEDLWEQLKAAARTAPTQLAASEVQLLGERLSQMRRDSLAALKTQSEGEIRNTEPLRRAANETAGHADVIAQAAKVFATEDNARLLAQSAQHLQRQEGLLTDNALPANRDAAQRPKWQEQQRAAIAATESTRKEMAALKSVVEGGVQKQMEDLDKQVAEAATDLRESLDKPDQTKSPEHLYGAADNLRQRLGRTADIANGIAENAANQAAQVRERLQRQPGPALAAVEQARTALQNAATEAKDKRPNKTAKLDRDGLTALQKAQKDLATAAKQLEDRGVLREQTPATNDQAALDANRGSRAAEKLAQDIKGAPPTIEAIAEAQGKAAQLAEVMRALEADALAQTAMKASEMAAANPDPTRAASPSQPAHEARAAAEALRQLPETLRKMKTPDPNLANTAQQAADANRQAAEQLQNLARQATAQPKTPLNLQPAQQAAAEAQQKAANFAEQLTAQTDAARQSLAQLTPQVSDMMKNVAADLKKTQQETQAAANEAQASKPVNEVAQKAEAIQPEAEKNAQKMESLQAALRQEANAANLAQADQRQMARMADVALSQMQKKSPQIAQNLKQAAQATQSQPQAQALQNAADAQQQTAQGLDQLAENMAKAETGKPLSEQELAAMQALEQKLGVQEPLDEAYKRAEELAKLAEKAKEDPAAALAALEKELTKNPIMKKALAELSKQTAQSSEEAVAAEAALPSNIGLATEKAAHDLSRVARHAQRLGQEQAAKDAAQASQQLAQSALAAKGQQGKPQQPVGQASQSTAAQAAKAAETAAAATPPAPAMSPFQQLQGAMLAQALDQLDQTVNPMKSASGQQEQQQAQQQQGGQPSAQQNLADAEQQQQQQMASQRNQGQTPGSQPSAQQTAQNPSNQPSQNSSPNQTPSEGGNLQAQMKDGALGAQLVLVDGNWGHLPSKMAEDLTEATRAEAAPEYRAAIESYYKAIATKAKK